MTTTQPQPVPVRPAIHDPQAARLLRLWVDLTRRAASAAAHDNGDEQSLRTLQLQVEDEIADRLPDSEALMIELVVWESTLIHTGQTPPESCLICHKAGQARPDLFIPAQPGGLR